MLPSDSRASDPARARLPDTIQRQSIPLSVAIVADDPRTAQALATACELMPSFECRVEIAGLREEAARLQTAPDVVIIVDRANTSAQHLEPFGATALPCVSIVHAAPRDAQADAAHAHARLLFSDLSPVSLELAVRGAQQNCRAILLARRQAQAVERAAVASREGQQRILEEIAPIARALEGLLDIMRAEGPDGAGPTPAQFGLLRNWTCDLVRAIGRHQDAAATPLGPRADLGAIVEDCAAMLRGKSDGLGHTVVLSNPREPVMVAVDPRRLQDAVRQLTESVFDRHARARRIDIVLWRSMEESRLAFVSGPPVRRGHETSDAELSPVRPAGEADARFIGALAQLRDLGAAVESNCANASGSSLLISLPAA